MYCTTFSYYSCRNVDAINYDISRTVSTLTLYTSGKGIRLRYKSFSACAHCVVVHGGADGVDAASPRAAGVHAFVVHAALAAIAVRMHLRKQSNVTHH